MVYSVVDGAVIYVCLLIRACMLCVLMFRCSSKKGSWEKDIIKCLVQVI